MAVSPYSTATDKKKHWWITNRKLVVKYIRDARCLIAMQEQNDIDSALVLLDAALVIELKARSLLYLRRLREVVEMLQDYIPSLKMSTNDYSSDYD